MRRGVLSWTAWLLCGLGAAQAGDPRSVGVSTPSPPSTSCPTPVPAPPGLLPSTPVFPPVTTQPSRPPSAGATPTFPPTTQPPTAAPPSAQAPRPATPQAPSAPQAATPAAPPSVSPSEAVAGGAPEAGSSALASAAPNMVGDFFGYRSLQTVQVVVPVFNSFGQQVGTTVKGVNVLDINGSRQAIKISEFESPLPQNRVFFSYNLYNNAGGKGGLTPTTFEGNLVVGGAVVNRRTTDIHRELAGFEKTFNDGYDSFGVRAPYIQQTGDGGTFNTDFGDVTVFWKHILSRDGITGSLVSTGLVVTTPTGPELLTPSGDVSNSVLIQPWFGYLVYLGGGRFYVQGFHGVVVPTLTRDTLFMNNDLAVGGFLLRPCRDRVLSMVALQAEGHVTTPLNHTGDFSAVPHLVVLTGGLHLGVGANSILTLGVGTPLTGVRPFEVEAACQLTFRF